MLQTKATHDLSAKLPAETRSKTQMVPMKQQNIKSTQEDTGTVRKTLTKYPRHLGHNPQRN